MRRLAFGIVTLAILAAMPRPADAQQTVAPSGLIANNASAPVQAAGTSAADPTPSTAQGTPTAPATPASSANTATSPASTPAPAPTATTSAPGDSTPAAATTTTAAAPESRPSSESWVTGNVDVGYRWVATPGGSFATYRSVVNLGSGPKLTAVDLTILQPSRRLFDSMHLRASGWGGDPYSTFHLDAKKAEIYRLNIDYRGISYFNNLPAYADPLLANGITLDEQSFDKHRRITSINLEIHPGRAFTPYVAAERDASSGTGVTVFQTGGNEYPIADTTDDATNLLRAGFRSAFRHFDATFEEGYTNFRSDQNDLTNTTSTGDNSTPVTGEKLDLTSLMQSYGIRGNSNYTKAIITSSPVSWLDVYAQAMYTVPRNTVNYQQYDAGNLVVLSELLFYNSEQYLVSSTTRFPHTTANVGWEIRPHHRVRILQSWLTDRMTNTGSATQNDTLLAAGATASSPGSTVLQTEEALNSSLTYHSSQAETNILVDAGDGLTARAGYRYVWGTANDAVLPADGLITLEQDGLRRNVEMGTLSWRPTQKLFLSGEAEVGESGGTYFRTSLYDYQRIRTMGRYSFLKHWQVSGDFRIMNNHNPLAGTSYKFITHQESVTLIYTPRSKTVSADATYEHCGYHSDIMYLVPQTLTPSDSVFTENCHRISGMFNANIKGPGKRTMTFEVGGSAVLTAGTNPTTYYQPTAKFAAPLTKNVAAFGEWRYYGFGEVFYEYQSFRAHLATVGLRYSR